MSVDLSNDFDCICGRRGCAENMVSGIGFTHQVKLQGRTDVLLENGRADVARLFELAKAQDETCTRIVEYGADTLACVIMNLVRVTDPELLILGGGIAGNDWFIQKVKQKLHASTLRSVKEICVSAFNSDFAGLIGAAAVGMQGLIK